MPVVKDWPPILSKGRLADLVERSVRDENSKSSYRDRLTKVAARVLERQIIQPAMIFDTFAISQRGGDWVRLSTGITLRTGTLAVDCMAGAQRLVVAIGTLGDGLEKEIHRLFAERRASDALALEDISVAALFAFSQEMTAYLGEIARRHSVHIGTPLGPGDEHFPISQQSVMAQMVEAEQIDIRTTKAGMLRPTKSLSMVIGMGTRPARWSSRARCDTCNQARHCEFRQSQVQTVAGRRPATALSNGQDPNQGA